MWNLRESHNRLVFFKDFFVKNWIKIIISNSAVGVRREYRSEILFSNIIRFK